MAIWPDLPDEVWRPRHRRHQQDSRDWLGWPVVAPRPHLAGGRLRQPPRPPPRLQDEALALCQAWSAAGSAWASLRVMADWALLALAQA